MIARALTLYSLLIFTAALLLAPASPGLHIDLMRSSVILFPHAVAIAYVSSLSKRRWKGVELLNAPLFLLPLNYDLLKHYLVVPSLHAAVHSFLSSKAWKGPFKRSLQMVSLSYVALAIYSLTSSSPFIDAVRLLAYPITLIYAVSCQSFPKTYGEEANWPLAFASSLAAFSFLLYPAPLYYLGLASTFTYLISIKLYKLGEYYSKVKQMEGTAGKAQEYFLLGHAFVAPSVLWPWLFSTDPLSLLHSTLLGFVALHVFIHFPFMVPIILRVRNRRRYCKLVFPLAELAALSWPLQRHLAYLLFLTAYATLLLSTFEVRRGRGEGRSSA